MTPSVLFGLINLGSAVLLIVVSVPLVLRKVRMNTLYGVRIKKSFSSDANWYAINEYGGKQLIFWSIPLILVGILCVVFPVIKDKEEPMAFIVGLVPMSVCLLGSMWRIWQFSRRL